MKKINGEPYLTPHRKINWRSILVFRVKATTESLLQENIENLYHLKLSKDFLDKTLRAPNIKCDILNLIKRSKLCSLKDTIKKMKK